MVDVGIEWHCCLIGHCSTIVCRSVVVGHTIAVFGQCNVRMNCHSVECCMQSLAMCP